MNTRQRLFSWKVIAVIVVVAIIAIVLFACIFPWLALLMGLALLAGGVAYAAWPPMSERLAILLSRPSPSLQSRIYIGAPIAVVGLILLALAQSQIRANWRSAETRAEVAQEIENAKSALDAERVDEALDICSKLDGKANSKEKKQLRAIRARGQTIQKAQGKKAANAKVAKLVSDGRYKIISGNLAAAESTLKSALNVPMATEFEPATALANEIVAAHTKSATRLLDEGEVLNAKTQIQRAIRVPSATDVAEANRIYIEICNLQVAMFVESAQAALAENKRDEAVVALENALALSDATETAEAQKMLTAIRETREAEANARVSTLMTQAKESVDAKQFDDAIRTLNAALAVPHSTQKTQVTAALKSAQEQQTAEKERAAALAKAAESAAQREAAQKRQKQNLDRFTGRLKSAGIDNSIIDSVSVKGTTATITVANTWHLLAYQIRLQAAQNLWKIWASIASPTDVDKARIKLVDFNGNEVGGSRFLAGSLIWVQKN